MEKVQLIDTVYVHANCKNTRRPYLKPDRPNRLSGQSMITYNPDGYRCQECGHAITNEEIAAATTA